MNQVVPMNAARASAILQERIAKGKAKSHAVLSKVLGELITDRVLSDTSKTAVELPTAPGWRGLGSPIRFRDPRSDFDRSVHPHAMRQMAEKLKVPSALVNYCLEPDVVEERNGEVIVSTNNAWRRKELESVFNTHLKQLPMRALTRSVSGQMRGFLSDRYRRFDSRRTLEAFIGACENVGAIPVDGSVSDIRAALKVVLPQVYEPVEGESMVFGLEWHDSQYGSARYSVRLFAERLICLNGMVGKDFVGQVHLGGKLPDNFAVSDKTYELDTQTMISLTNDVVRAALAEDRIEQMCQQVRDAHSQEISWDKGWARVSKALTKGEGVKLKDAFNGTDEVMMPAGKTAWRFSNALSWLAGTSEDPERKMELQRLAGQQVDGFGDKGGRRKAA